MPFNDNTEGEREINTRVEEEPEYQAVSAYLADPELTEYRHRYFKRLELEYPKLQKCQQREMQRALLSVAMNDHFREEVRDRAVKYQKRREQREQRE